MINRRQFLGNTAMAILSSQMLAACASRSTTPSEKDDQIILFVYDGNGTIVRRLGLRSGNYTDLRIPIVYPHSAHKVLGSSDELIILGFFSSAFKVNFVTKEVRHIQPEGYVFMGHGIQASVPGIIWCSEILNDGDIIIRKRSTEDLSLATGVGSVFPGAHHLVRLPGTETVATGSTDFNAGKSVVRFFDAKSGQEKVFDIPGKFGLGHMLALSDTELICIVKHLDYKPTAPVDEMKWQPQLEPRNWRKSYPAVKYRLNYTATAPLVYANTSGTVKFFSDEPKMDLMAFSFGFDLIPGSPARFISGHANPNAVILWNRDLTIQDVISVPHPIGLLSASDGKGFHVLSKGALKYYSLQDRAFTSEIKYDAKITGITRF